MQAPQQAAAGEAGKEGEPVTPVGRRLLVLLVSERRRLSGHLNARVLSLSLFLSLSLSLSLSP